MRTYIDNKLTTAYILSENAIITTRQVPSIIATAAIISDLFFMSTTAGAAWSNFFYYFTRQPKHQLGQLIDIAITDKPRSSVRFTLRYLFLSHRLHWRSVLSFAIPELAQTPSLTRFPQLFFSATRTLNIFKSASWLERESWDMFGVYFSYHRDARRLLTDYGFIGYPLRKDFPLTGFFEIFFSDVETRIISRPVELAQEWRNLTL